MLEGILQFLGGLGFFLFGMNYLEQSVSSLSNGGFKNLLKKFTSSKIKSFGSGILITMLLQSSNVVSVLVLAFVGTGILSLTSALSVILGANVGSGITASLLGVVGLSFDVAKIALPLIFLGAIGINFLSRWSKVVSISKFFLSFGMIFLAFSLMKEGLGFVTDTVDFSEYAKMSPRIFFLIGRLLTTLVQSGTIVYIISLTLAYTGILQPEQSLAIIFATYLGSTITIVLGAIGANKLAIKKQVAVWHVGFNMITSVLGIICLPLITKLYSNVLELKFGIVIGITIIYFMWRTIFACMFLFLVNPVSKWLTKFIKDKKQRAQLAIHKIFNVENLDPSVAQLAVKQDMFLLFRNAIKYNLNVRDFSPLPVEIGESTEEKLATALTLKGDFDKNDLTKVYGDVKYIQNQLLEFLISLPVSDKSAENAELYQSVISVLDSCKTIKDVWSHIEDWQWSSSDNLQKDYESTREMVIVFYSTILHLYQRFDSKKALADAHEALELLQKENDEYLAEIRPRKSDDLPLTALIQTRRYFVQSCQDLLHAMELFKAGPDEIKYFKENMSNFMK